MRTAHQKNSIRERYLAVDTANVADTLDKLGLPDQGLSADFAPYSGERLGGWAYTIAGQTQPYEGTGDAKKMEACAGLSDGEISVWSGNGQGVCYFGELIAIGMKERGSVGALVDGGIRDVRWLREHEFPVFARYRTPTQSIGRWKVTAWQEPVSMPGATSTWVTVVPGDFILADEDGAIVIPDAHVEAVLAEAEALTATEVQIREALRQGRTLAECLAEFGHV
jgi:regulator of RNase E activity RraA